MRNNSSLKNRSERTGNLVSIEAYDNTSRAYSKEANQKPEIGFSAYLTVAVLVFLVVFFMGLYELVLESWALLK